MSEYGRTPEANREQENFRFGVASEPSEKHPQRNEDNYFIAPERGVFAVFDGMGGHASGDAASRLAKDALAELVSRLPAEHDDEAAKKWLRNTLIALDRTVVAPGRQRQELRGMGTAGSVFVATQRDGKPTGLAGTAADTRVWQFQNNILRQISIDNIAGTASESDAQAALAMIQKLNMIKNENDLEQLSPAESYLFDNRNYVENHLGSGIHKPRIESFDLSSPSKVLLSTDGIHDNLTGDEMASVLSKIDDPEEAARHLVRMSQRRSRDKDHIRHKPDDMTAVVVSWNNQE